MRILFFLVLNFFVTATWACGPVTHVYLANMWLDSRHVTDDIARRDFMIGTLFPDIRYFMSNLSREHTHTKDVTLKQVDEQKDYFKKGMLYHAYIDDQHEAFTNVSKAYQYLPKNIDDSRSIFIEFIMDEILFDSVWIKPIAKNIHSVIDEEKILGLSSAHLYPWHILLNVYFMDLPSESFKQLSFLKINVSFLNSNMIKIWSEELPKMKKHVYYKKYVAELVALFKRNLEVKVH